LVIEPHNTCPHWLVTDHGTVRCDRVGLEAITDWGDYDENLAAAEAALTPEGFARIRTSSTFLGDQIKICDIHPAVPGFDDVDTDDAQH
jgi:hypothetical protein